MYRVLSRAASLGFCFFALLMLGSVGCAEKKWPAIPIEAAKRIQSGTALADIVDALGEPHAPTARQSEAIEGNIERMPPPIQANARKHRHLAWGTDESFFVAVVNEEDVAWAVSWHSHN